MMRLATRAHFWETYLRPTVSIDATMAGGGRLGRAGKVESKS